MKKLSKFIDIILYIIVGIVLAAAITSAIWDKPMIFSSIRSNSMYPLFQRSDMILIKGISDKDMVNIGDIVVFKVEEGSLSSQGWIVHRIIEGDELSGYITKGDANDYTDQSSGGNSRIKKEWITSKVLTIGKQPLKIPLIGYLSLWMEKLQTNLYTIPIIAVVLAVIVGISELNNGKKKKRKKKRNGLELQLIYFFGGLTISVIMAATMLATSQRILLPYEVSENGVGVVMGSSVGIIRVGDEIEKPLSELNNKGFLPIISTITTTDEQITFSHPLITLKTGADMEVLMKLKASMAGKYNTIIHVGMFYPFLPSNWIYSLSLKSYWLALIIVSLIPGLPLMIYPLIDDSMRKKTIKEIRRMISRILRLIPMIN